MGVLHKETTFRWLMISSSVCFLVTNCLFYFICHILSSFKGQLQLSRIHASYQMKGKIGHWYKLTHDDCKGDRKVCLKQIKGKQALSKCLYFWLVAKQPEGPQRWASRAQNQMVEIGLTCGLMVHPSCTHFIERTNYCWTKSQVGFCSQRMSPRCMHLSPQGITIVL